MLLELEFKQCAQTASRYQADVKQCPNYSYRTRRPSLEIQSEATKPPFSAFHITSHCASSRQPTRQSPPEKMPLRLTFTTPLLPRASLDLGYLVLNKTLPTQDYHALPVPPSSIISASSLELLNRQTKKTGASLRAQLTKHLRASLDVSSNLELHIEAESGTSYAFGNSQEWYAKQKLGEPVKKWLERAIARGMDVYLVVGLYTLQNVRVSLRDCRGRDVQSASTVGITDFAALGPAAVAVSMVPAVKDVLGVSAKAGGKAGDNTEYRWRVEEEVVYAVQYRKIEFRWFFSRSVEKSFLEKGNRWQILWGTRGHVDSQDNEGEEDVVEAVLADTDGEADEEIVDGYEDSETAKR